LLETKIKAGLRKVSMNGYSEKKGNQHIGQERSTISFEREGLKKTDQCIEGNRKCMLFWGGKKKIKKNPESNKKEPKPNYTEKRARASVGKKLGNQTDFENHADQEKSD